MEGPDQDHKTVRRLRRWVGIVAFLIAPGVTFGNMAFTGRLELLPSISGSYYTPMRNIFVGSLCAVGVLLVCYRYEKLDDVLSTVAGWMATLVALFPTAPHLAPGSATPWQIWSGRVHAGAAILLFALLAVFCFFLFTRQGQDEDGNALEIAREKRIRNRIYRSCGTLIVLGLATAIAGGLLLSKTAEGQIRPLFWGETLALLAFGAAWFVKSQSILNDVRPAIPEQVVPSTPVGELSR